MKVEHVKSYHTNQPYVPYDVYRITFANGRTAEFTVCGSHMAQTWDCQPYHVQARIYDCLCDDGTPFPVELAWKLLKGGT